MDSDISRTIFNDKGEIIFFGIDHFINDIAKGDCCFICGAKSNSKDFNDEHIIPDWILTEYNLKDKFITLTNGTRFKYRDYKVPCCKECNSKLGETYELPISHLLKKTYSEIIQEIKKKPEIMYLLFKWLSLIFVKTHLKDRSLHSERDKRLNSGFLSDDYDWDDIHHIHCIARSFYSNAKIDLNVYGSILILPVIKNKGLSNFDFIDNLSSKGIMIQLDEFVIISILNDSRACTNFFYKQLEKINGSISTFQTREIMAHLNFINYSLKERPKYYSLFSENGEYLIKAKIPKKIQLIDENERIITHGNFLRYYLEDKIGNIENKEKILKEIELGKRSYLFDENGEFVNHNK